ILRLPPPGRVFLYDLPETDVRNVHDNTVKQGHRISVNGVPSPRGLWMVLRSNPSSYVSFSLGKKYQTLQATAAINDTTGPTGSQTALIFKVLGDGKVLWESKPLQKQGSSQSFTVSVAGVDKLELEVHCPGTPANAHAVWVEPQLLP